MLDVGYTSVNITNLELLPITFVIKILTYSGIINMDSGVMCHTTPGITNSTDNNN